MKNSSLLVQIVALSSLGACDSGLGNVCRSDLDCKGDRICVERVCEFPEDISPDRGDDGTDLPVWSVDSGTSGARDAGGRDSGRAGGDAGCSVDCPGLPVVEGLHALDLSANAIAVDNTRGRLYATMSATDDTYPNQLVTVDLESAAVVHSVAIGSDPTTLALSDDDSTLWVSLSGSYAIREVDVTGEEPVPGLQFSLPPGQFGDMAAAGPMVVLPGTKNSVAVSMHRSDVSPSFAGAVVLDEGVARATLTAGHTGASRLTLGPAGYLFGYNNLHTGFGFYSLSVSPSGLTQSEFADLVDGFATDIAYGYGYVYATSGEVVDVSAPSQPRRAGRFPFGGAVLPLPDARALLLSADNNPFPASAGEPALRLMDTSTFTQLDEVAMPKITGARNLERITPNGIAFVAAASSSGSFGGISSGIVYIMRDTGLSE